MVGCVLHHTPAPHSRWAELNPALGPFPPSPGYHHQLQCAQALPGGQGQRGCAGAGARLCGISRSPARQQESLLNRPLLCRPTCSPALPLGQARRGVCERDRHRSGAPPAGVPVAEEGRQHHAAQAGARARPPATAVAFPAAWPALLPCAPAGLRRSTPPPPPRHKLPNPTPPSGHGGVLPPGRRLCAAHQVGTLPQRAGGLQAGAWGEARRASFLLQPGGPP
jgi:hypothetical protein